MLCLEKCQLRRGYPEHGRQEWQRGAAAGFSVLKRLANFPSILL